MVGRDNRRTITPSSIVGSTSVVGCPVAPQRGSLPTNNPFSVASWANCLDWRLKRRQVPLQGRPGRARLNRRRYGNLQSGPTNGAIRLPASILSIPQITRMPRRTCGSRSARASLSSADAPGWPIRGFAITAPAPLFRRVHRLGSPESARLRSDLVPACDADRQSEMYPAPRRLRSQKRQP